MQVDKIHTKEDLLNEGMSDYFATYHILKRLTLPYEKWDQYKAGIIDKDGNVDEDLLRQNPTLKQKLSLFDRLVIGIRKIFKKFMGNKKLTLALILKFLYNSLNETVAEDVVSALMQQEELNEDLNTINESELVANYRIVQQELEHIMEL